MKKLISVISIIFLLCASLSVAAADTNIVPYYNNTNTTFESLTISSTGMATVVVSYNGKVGVTTGGTISSYIERKVGTSWVKVSNGQPLNTWTDTSANRSYSTSHTLQLSVKGEYRLCVTYTIRGTGGSPDVINRTVYKTY